MKRGNALPHARRSFRPFERELVLRLVYFVVLVVKFGLDLFLRGKAGDRKPHREGAASPAADVQALSSVVRREYKLELSHTI